MSDTVIKVENLSKLYRLGEISTGTLSHDLNRWFAKIRGKEDPFARVGKVNDRTKKTEKDEFVWALKDINFEVKQGEVLGIIGKNGAGKSSLLKILSRITAPTTGEVKIKGRVGSLLEVGTGFHPEMTGRENIYLNGTILGMTRKEITSKFDDIIDFSGVTKYVDTPVKRFSTGMKVRLGFAVAAFLEPEILVVDEVLAVGDAEFQNKAVGKMEEVSNQYGRTVLFVSHNLGNIAQLCKKSLILDKGKLSLLSNTNEVIELYISANNSYQSGETKIIPGTIQFVSIRMMDVLNVEKYQFRYDEDFLLDLKIIIPIFYDTLELAVSLYDHYKRRVFTIHEALSQFKKKTDFFRFNITIPGKFITPGRYSWLMCINHPGIELFGLRDDICSFTIMETGSAFARYDGADYGCVNPQYTLKYIESQYEKNF